MFTAAAEAAIVEYRDHPDVTRLQLSPEETGELDESCRSLVDRYLAMEDPRRVVPVGLELWLEADVGNLNLRGIIDRLELRDGELVVTDDKTGRPPSVNWELRSMVGVYFYALLCRKVFGRLRSACST